MANGKLGSLAVPAGSYGTLFQATSNKVTTFNLSICNTAADARTFRVAIAAATTPVGGEHVEYEVNIPGSGTYERTALVASGAEYILVYGSATGLEARAHGFEQ